MTGPNPADGLPHGAIVVLGCRVHPSGRLPPAAEGRAAAAVRAYREGKAPWIVASGGRRWGNQVEALALREELVLRGVPREAILVELWSMTTYENAVFSAAILSRLGARSALIVTCAWHAPRALMSFRSAGIEAIAWPRDANAGAFDRAAEGVRHALDARAIRRHTAVPSAAAMFFRSSAR